VASTGASVFGPVDHTLGGLHRLLGHLDESIAHYEAADEIARRMDAPFFIARTAVDLAQALRERGAEGDEDRARALVAEATDLAERHGCAWVVARA
jgi:ATP/maltotriose-dependent transcriptional regulator MalT